MARLEPVDFDPFAAAQQPGATVDNGRLNSVTVRTAGAAPRLEPVSHDPFAEQSIIPAAIRDIPKEVGSAVGQAFQRLTRNSVRELPGYDPRRAGEMSELERLQLSGRQIMALPELAMAVPVGVARSVGGHLLADATQYLGEKVVTPAMDALGLQRKADALPPTNDQLYDTAKEDVDLALAATRGGIKSTPKNIQPQASDIFATAKPYYRQFDREAENTFVAPNQAIDRIKGAMTRGKQPEHLAEEVYSTVDTLRGSGRAPTPLEKLEAEMNGLPVPGQGNKFVPLSTLRDVKELVGQSFKSNDARVRAAAGIATREINKIITEISPQAGGALKTADEIYSAAKSLRELQQAQDVAGLRTGRAGYGGNATNALKQVLSPIVEKSIKGKITGFKPEEIAAMREIVEGTDTTNAVRMVGQMSPTKGSIPTMGAIGASIAAGNPAPLAIPALGAASNKLAAKMTAAQLERLKGLVAKRSPAYAEAVKKATARYEKAQEEMLNAPTPARVAAYAAASRALASGLTRDGIAVTSGDLMRVLEGPIGSRAEDQQRPPAQ